MLIDWTTVLFQIVNFVILMALLKHFLYGRIVKAMDEREQRIQNEMEEAQKKQAAAEERKRKFEEKTRELEEHRQEKLKAAKQEADETRKRLTQEARQDASELKKRWKSSIQREQNAFLTSLRQMAGREVYAAARRALADLADAELEDQAARVFLARLKNLGDDQVQTIRDNVAKQQVNNVSIKSAFELAGPMKQKITKAVRERIDRSLEVEYEVDQDLICGLELKAPGMKLTWSVDDYLRELTEKARQALEEEVQTEQVEAEGEAAHA